MTGNAKIVDYTGHITDFNYNGDTPTLTEIRNALGGFMQPIDCFQMAPWFSETPIMLIDMAGANKGLPLNRHAQRLAGTTYHVQGSAIFIAKSLIS